MRRGPPHTPPRALATPPRALASSPSRGPGLSLAPLMSAVASGSARAMGDQLTVFYTAGTSGQVLDLSAARAVDLLAALAVAAKLCPEHHYEVAYLLSSLAGNWMDHINPLSRATGTRPTWPARPDRKDMQ